MSLTEPPDLPRFQQIQQIFAEHIKHPERCAKPAGVDDRHMAVYRDLFFKNIMSFISGAFPVLADILGEQRWRQLGREFFSQHNNASPLFLDISREFLTFLQYEYQPISEDPEYILELAHYEWLELYVDVTTETHSLPAGYHYSDNRIDKVEDALIVLSEVVETGLYRYPVHQVSIDNKEVAEEATALIVYRAQDVKKKQTNANSRVKFAQTNPFTLQLITLLTSDNKPTNQEQLVNQTLPTPWLGNELVNTVLLQAGLAGNETAYRGGIETLQLWLSMGIIRMVEADSLKNS